MLDALGVRNLSIEECNNFLQKWRKLIDKTGETIKLTVDARYAEINKSFKEQNPDAPNPSAIETDIRPDYMTFGDTIILMWYAKYGVKQYIIPLSFVLSQIIISALEEGLPLRGAVSEGEFIEAENEDQFGSTHRTVIGPAVSEAAIWHDKANLIGVIAAPTFDLRVSQLELMFKKAGQRIPPHWVHCEIPDKEGHKTPRWSVGWPNMHCNAESNIDNRKYDLLEYLSRCPHIYDDSKKYNNTIEYYDNCINEEKTKKPPDAA